MQNDKKSNVREICRMSIRAADIVTSKTQLTTLLLPAVPAPALPPSPPLALTIPTSLVPSAAPVVRLQVLVAPTTRRHSLLLQERMTKRHPSSNVVCMLRKCFPALLARHMRSTCSSLVCSCGFCLLHKMLIFFCRRCCLGLVL